MAYSRQLEEHWQRLEDVNRLEAAAQSTNRHSHFPVEANAEGDQASEGAVNNWQGVFAPVSRCCKPSLCSVGTCDASECVFFNKWLTEIIPHRRSLPHAQHKQHVLVWRTVVSQVY